MAFIHAVTRCAGEIKVFRFGRCFPIGKLAETLQKALDLIEILR